MLDEAFTRIDDEGRRGIMGLISKFDLDIMLTSPDYWGCCAEVPELDIYVLAPRDPSCARRRHPPLPLGRPAQSPRRRAAALAQRQREGRAHPAARRTGNSISTATPPATAARDRADGELPRRAGIRRGCGQAARTAFERNGGLGGQALVTDLSADEATALNGLLRRRQRPPGRSRRPPASWAPRRDAASSSPARSKTCSSSSAAASRTGPRSVRPRAAREAALWSDLTERADRSPALLAAVDDFRASGLLKRLAQGDVLRLGRQALQRARIAARRRTRDDRPCRPRRQALRRRESPERRQATGDARPPRPRPQRRRPDTDERGRTARPLGTPRRRLRLALVARPLSQPAARGRRAGPRRRSRARRRW